MFLWQIFATPPPPVVPYILIINALIILGTFLCQFCIVALFYIILIRATRLKNIISYAFQRILDLTYDGSNWWDCYVCVIIYTLYGIILGGMPQFSGLLPVHYEYTKYLRVLKNHPFAKKDNNIKNINEYVAKCITVWRLVEPVYYMFKFFNLKPLFEMPLTDKSYDNWGNNYLIKAVAASDNDVNKVKPFLESFLENKKNIDATGHFNDNALAHAVILEYNDVVKLLLENGADPSCKVAFAGTALHWAEATGNQQIIDCIKSYYHASLPIN